MTEQQSNKTKAIEELIERGVLKTYDMKEIESGKALGSCDLAYGGCRRMGPYNWKCSCRNGAGVFKAYVPNRDSKQYISPSFVAMFYPKVKPSVPMGLFDHKPTKSTPLRTEVHYLHDDYRMG
jgi:hypothetical protein